MSDTPRTDTLYSQWRERLRTGSVCEADLHALCLKAAAVLEELVLELAEARKDAQRYEWLVGRLSEAEYRRIGVMYDDRYSLDAAIDAAREASK